MNNQQNYFVYIHINKINHKKYIGITQQDPTIRWGSNGIHYQRQLHFYNAIQKYGWDNFEHIIYQTGLTKGQACGIEQQLILLFETNNPDNGYNISGGGETGGYIDGRYSDPEYKKKANRKWRKSLTKEQKEKIYEQSRKHRREKIKNETTEEREERLTKQREYGRKRIRNETPEQREKRLARQKEYDKKRRS